MRTMLKSKIHRATVTDADIDYEGSITLDPLLMDAADILPYEQVHIIEPGGIDTPFPDKRRLVGAAAGDETSRV